MKTKLEVVSSNLLVALKESLGIIEHLYNENPWSNPELDDVMEELYAIRDNAEYLIKTEPKPLKSTSQFN